MRGWSVSVRISASRPEITGVMVPGMMGLSSVFCFLAEINDLSKDDHAGIDRVYRGRPIFGIAVSLHSCSCTYLD
jgi:hypothetical protein